ncbi:LapA family protein [Microbacterium sp. UCD-TDU]|uniref:LapA family protein n=1 Tax=Microbacterium sp. UCD-TDU TaxID=1247714 RepID=UPI0003668B04|nr:LapA family protein [Microbacterium sp. UCD-TDU]EYT59750.1 hypothetical protein D514_0111590 [Microbacterium sp. UCD-TDU]
MLIVSVVLAATTPPSAANPGSWTLTLDTLIAGLGALVTIVLTVLALLQTKRGNALQMEAHRLQKEVHDAQERLDARQRRFRLYQAMLTYIDVVETGRHPADEHDAMVMTSVENGFGHDAPVLQWVEIEGAELAEFYQRVERDDAGRNVSPETFWDHVAAKLALRRRLSHWVDTGDYPRDKTWYEVPDTPATQ